jgi:Transcriptional regulator, AbiEi antitoxin/Protein of unknown function (DUF559)
VVDERSRGLNERRPPHPDELLAALAARQHGLVTLGQLFVIGLSRAAVAYRVQTGRLHRVHRGVYAVGHSRLSQEGLWMAAVLAAGAGAALSHLSAATLWQAWRKAPAQVDVVAPRALRAHSGIRLRRCRRLDPRDVTVRNGVPVTTMARTLVDLADVLDAARLANVMHEAAFQRRFDRAATRAAMARANGRPRLGVLEAALRLNELGSAGTRSGLESRFLALVRSAGLPDPLPNVTLHAGDRRIEVDFHWPELELCVETDGGGHARPRTRRDDVGRDRVLRAAGHEVLRFGELDVDDRPEAVIAAIRARSPRGR